MWPARGMPGRGVTPMRWKQGCHGTVRPELSKSCLTVIGAQIPAGKAGWGREALISCRAKEGYQTGLAWEWNLLAGLSSVRMRCTGAQGAGRGLSICPVGPLLDLQGKVELWVGGGWGLGKVQLGVFLSLGGIFITGWDSRSVEEVATHFRPGIFFLCAGAGHVGFFPRLHFHTPPLLAGQAWA